MGDVGGWRHDDLDAGPATSFTIPYSGTFKDIDFAEANPSFMVRVGTGKSSASPAYHGTAFTTDGGKTWFQGNVDPAADKGAGTVAAAAAGSRVLWASNDASVPVSYSTDLGNSWQPCAGVPNAAVVAADRVNAPWSEISDANTSLRRCKPSRETRASPVACTSARTGSVSSMATSPSNRRANVEPRDSRPTSG